MKYNQIIIIPPPHRLSVNYGVNTYLKEYIYCLRTLGVHVVLLDITTNVNNFSIKEHDGLKILTFPCPDEYYEETGKYLRNIMPFLRLYLDSFESTIFSFQSIFNGIEDVREYIAFHFPLAKVMVTLHYSGWIDAAGYDGQLFRKIIGNMVDLSCKYPDVVKSYRYATGVLNSMDEIVCLADDTYHTISDCFHVSPSKLHLIPNGISDVVWQMTKESRANLRQKLHIDDRELILLFVGRLETRKGGAPLLQSFNKILSKHSNCRLVMIGSWDNVSIVRNCVDSWTKISFTGTLNQEDISRWYQAADIAVFPSYMEECSYVGIEMMMYGLPIVASDGYNVGSMFRDGENAIVAHINYDSPEEFVHNLEKAISQLVYSENLRNFYSHNSRRIYENEYRIDVMCDNYRLLFETMSNNV